MSIRSVFNWLGCKIYPDDFTESYCEPKCLTVHKETLVVVAVTFFVLFLFLSFLSFLSVERDLSSRIGYSGYSPKITLMSSRGSFSSETSDYTTSSTSSNSNSTEPINSQHTYFSSFNGASTSSVNKQTIIDAIWYNTQNKNVIAAEYLTNAFKAFYYEHLPSSWAGGINSPHILDQKTTTKALSHLPLELLEHFAESYDLLNVRLEKSNQKSNQTDRKVKKRSSSCNTQLSVCKGGCTNPIKCGFMGRIPLLVGLYNDNIRDTTWEYTLNENLSDMEIDWYHCS